jgi:hypothetical protein
VLALGDARRDEDAQVPDARVEEIDDALAGGLERFGAGAYRRHPVNAWCGGVMLSPWEAKITSGLRMRLRSATQPSQMRISPFSSLLPMKRFPTMAVISSRDRK